MSHARATKRGAAPAPAERPLARRGAFGRAAALAACAFALGLFGCTRHEATAEEEKAAELESAKRIVATAQSLADRGEHEKAVALLDAFLEKARYPRSRGMAETARLTISVLAGTDEGKKRTAAEEKGRQPAEAGRKAAAAADEIRNCAGNLKQIGMALQLFAMDNDERFPATIKELHPNLVVDKKLFSCPSRGGAMDYEYVPGLGATDPADFVVAYDKEGNHDGGRNVLYVSGAVTWKAEADFQRDLRRTLAHAMGKLDEKRKEAPSPPAASFSGTWAASYGDMVLRQTGNTVTGTYEHNRGQIAGTVTGRKLAGRYWEGLARGVPYERASRTVRGPIDFVLSEDGRSFAGKWRTESSGATGKWLEWKGIREPFDPPGQLQSARQAG